MIDTAKYISEVFNEDCMVGMSRYPDKWFDLAVVDPPYGIGIVSEFKKTIASNSSMMRGSNGVNGSEWDMNPPDATYFKELIRISINQVIWGGNYFLDHLGSSRCFLVWDKMNGTNPMADAELAWTSYDKSVRMFRMHHFSQGYDAKIHPTQKPVKLYDWIYKNYLPQGGKVIDTHLGSGSNRIAANKAGNIDFTGFELDKDYYEAQEKRWKGFISQTRLF